MPKVIWLAYRPDLGLELISPDSQSTFHLLCFIKLSFVLGRGVYFKHNINLTQIPFDNSLCKKFMWSLKRSLWWLLMYQLCWSQKTYICHSIKHIRHFKKTSREHAERDTPNENDSVLICYSQYRNIGNRSTRLSKSNSFLEWFSKIFLKDITFFNIP